MATKPKRVIKVPGVDGATPLSEDRSRVLAGYEAEIDELVELHSSMERARRRFDEIRARLDAIADAERCTIEAATGQPCKHLQVKGSTTNGRYTFADRYHVVDRACIPDLRKMLGVHFDALFRSTEKVSLKPDAAARLLALMRAQNSADEYFSVDPCVTPIDDFRSVRALLRGSLSAETNNALDTFVKEMANRPSLSLK